MIIKAASEHAGVLSEIGVESFYKAHKDSAPAHEISSYVKKNYNTDAIRNELANPANIYHLILHEGNAAGFSKMEFNMRHPAIEQEHVSKLDQIYLLDSFHGMKLGAKLLSYNINLSKLHGQSGMWLVVWTGNSTAISFYRKFGFEVAAIDHFRLSVNHLNSCYIMWLQYDLTKIG